MTLHDRDELLHPPPAPTPPQWQENLFFICWDVRTTSGAVCHIRRVPGQGIQEAQVVVAIEGRVASALLEAPFRPDALVPGLVATPVVPFQRWSIRLDSTGVEGVGPLGFVASTPGGDMPIGVDLTLESTLPVADFADGLAAMVAGMQERPDGPQMGDQQHYEQGGTWRGRLRIGSHGVDADGLFVRDHSWGVRDEQQHFEAFWTASCLDDGKLFCNAIGVPSGGRVIGIGAVVNESGATFTTDVGAAFSPTAGVCAYDRTSVEFGAPIARTLTAETQLHVPLYFVRSGPGRYDNNALSTVQMGDATGFGVMEWASVLTGDELASVTAGEAVS